MCSNSTVVTWEMAPGRSGRLFPVPGAVLPDEAVQHHREAPAALLVGHVPDPDGRVLRDRRDDLEVVGILGPEGEAAGANNRV